jgi:hypothetical protein
MARTARASVGGPGTADGGAFGLGGRLAAPWLGRTLRPAQEVGIVRYVVGLEAWRGAALNV